jgi:tetratricopeptide (TPR) repeat protein
VTTLASTAVTSAALAMTVLSAAGCGDTITFATESRKQGLSLYKEGNYADAAGSFRNAVKQDPRDYRSYYYLGTSYDAMQRYQEAIGSYRSALDTMNVTLEGKNDTQFRRRVVDALAIAVSKSSDRQRQIDNIVAAGKGRETPEQFVLLGKIHRYSNDPDGAIEAYNRAALLDPKDFAVAKEYGLYLVQINQTERGETVLRRAYQMNPRDQEVLEGLRKIGVVPGPSLKDENQLAQPGIPKGPLPPAPGGTAVVSPRD